MWLLYYGNLTKPPLDAQGLQIPLDPGHLLRGYLHAGVAWIEVNIENTQRLQNSIAIGVAIGARRRFFTRLPQSIYPTHLSKRRDP